VKGFIHTFQFPPPRSTSWDTQFVLYRSVACAKGADVADVWIFPGWGQGFGGASVEAFVEVAVDVEDGPYAGVPEPGGDDCGVGALGDEEGDVAVAEVVEAHGFSHRLFDGGFPVAGAEAAASQGPVFGCGEDEPVVGGPGGQVLVEGVGEPVGQDEGASGRSGLGLAQVQLPAYFGEGAFDAEGLPLGLVVAGVEGGEFPEAGPGVGGGEHQRLEPGPDRFGEPGDFGG